MFVKKQRVADSLRVLAKRGGVKPILPPMARQ